MFKKLLLTLACGLLLLPAYAAFVAPVPSTSERKVYYKIRSFRGDRCLVSNGAGNGLTGEAGVTSDAAYWRFEVREDGSYNIINYADASYLAPGTGNSTTTCVQTQSTAPTVGGWVLEQSNVNTDYFIIHSNDDSHSQLNQEDGTNVWNWGYQQWDNTTNSNTEGFHYNDEGCAFVLVMDADKSDPLYANVDMTFDGTSSTAPFQVPELYATQILENNALTIAIDYTTTSTDKQAFFSLANSTNGTAYCSIGTTYLWQSHVQKDGSKYTLTPNVSPTGTNVRIVVVMQNLALNAYLSDGSQLQTATSDTENATTINAYNNIYIGGITNAIDAVGKRLFNGTINSIRFYNEALTSEEVATFTWDNISPTVTVKHPVTIEPSAENGSFTLWDGTTQINSGDEVREGALLTVNATPADDYVLDQILVNGKAQSGTSFTVTEATTVTVTFIKGAEACYPTWSAAGQNDEKNIYFTSITTEGALDGDEVSYTATARPNSDTEHYYAASYNYYYQLPDVLTVTPGQSLTLKWTGPNNSSFLNCIAEVFADWNGDGAFDGSFPTKSTTVDADISGEGEENTEYVYILGHYNDPTDGLKDFSYTFTVPTTAAFSKTRIRIKLMDAWNVDWEPCGSVRKGLVYDIPVKIVGTKVTIEEAENGSITATDNNGATYTAGTHEMVQGTVLTVAATPNNDSYALETLTVTGAIANSDGTYTVGADDVNIAATFVVAAKYAVTVKADAVVEYTIYQGETALDATALAGVISGTELKLVASSTDGAYLINAVTWSGTTLQASADGSYPFTVTGDGELAITTRNFEFSDFDAPTFTTIGNTGVVLSATSTGGVKNISFGPFSANLNQHGTKEEELLYQAEYGYKTDGTHDITAYPNEQPVELDIKIDAIWGKFALFMGTNNSNMERVLLCGNPTGANSTDGDYFDNQTLYIEDKLTNTTKVTNGTLPHIDLSNAEIGTEYLIRLVFFGVSNTDTNEADWTFNHTYNEGHYIDFKLKVIERPVYDVKVEANDAIYTLKNGEDNWVLGINPDNIEESSETNETTALHNEKYTLVVHYAEGKKVTQVTWGDEVLTPEAGDFTVSSVYTFPVTSSGTLIIHTETVSYTAPTGTATYTNYVATLSMSSKGWENGFKLDIHSGEESSIYNDYTDDKIMVKDEDGKLEEALLTFPVETKEKVNITITTTGTPRNQYLYVDWNKDGDFTDDRELVYNSEIATLSTESTSTFTVPENLISGMYRARFEVDADSTTPDALAELADGASITDFTLYVVNNDTTNFPTAIEEVENAVELYYANGNIYTNVAGEIFVYDLSGKLVRRAQSAPVAVDDLANGIYIVRVNGNTLKFVK